VGKKLLSLLLTLAAFAATALTLPAASSANCKSPYCPSYTLTVVKEGTGLGFVDGSPEGIDCGSECSAVYEEGTVVTLTAIAFAPVSSFAGWSGGGCSGTGTCVVTIKADTTVTAIFNAISPGGLRVARLARVRRAKARVRSTCEGEGSCEGVLKLVARIAKGKTTKRVIVGKTPFSLAAGAKKRLVVRLSHGAMRELRKHRFLRVRAIGPDVIKSTVKLKLVRKKHPRHP
jgi:hypothetical protein